MASELFQIDAKNIFKLKKFYKKSKKDFARAVAAVLNEFAFRTRDEILGVIQDKMTVRSASFVRGSVRVERAKPGNISNMKSSTGTIRRPRFTGWIEQSLGRPPQKTRATTLFARGGNKGRRLKPSYRIRSIKKKYDVRQIRGRNQAAKNAILFRTVKKEAGGKPFLLFGHKDFKSGAYLLKRGRLRRIQTFGVKKKLKKINVVEEGRKRYFQKTNINLVWAAALKRTLKI